jgi:nitrogen fixation/metabolism regulation signal transduction histidine kinase
MADPVQIEQVLMNLCINARDAIDGRGTSVLRSSDRCPARAVCASCPASVHAEGQFVACRVR